MLETMEFVPAYKIPLVNPTTSSPLSTFSSAVSQALKVTRSASTDREKACRSVSPWSGYNKGKTTEKREQPRGPESGFSWSSQAHHIDSTGGAWSPWAAWQHLPIKIKKWIKHNSELDLSCKPSPLSFLFAWHFQFFYRGFVEKLYRDIAQGSMIFFEDIFI